MWSRTGCGESTRYRHRRTASRPGPGARDRPRSRRWPATSRAQLRQHHAVERERGGVERAAAAPLRCPGRSDRPPVAAPAAHARARPAGAAPCSCRGGCVRRARPGGRAVSPVRNAASNDSARSTAAAPPGAPSAAATDSIWALRGMGWTCAARMRQSFHKKEYRSIVQNNWKASRPHGRHPITRRADQRGRPARRPAIGQGRSCRPPTSASGSTRCTPPACARSRSRSFVPAKLLPQMADAAEVVRHALTLPGPDGDGAGAQPARRAGGAGGRRAQAHDSGVGQRRAFAGQRAQDARGDDRRGAQHRGAAQRDGARRQDRGRHRPRPSAARSRARSRKTTWSGWRRR